MQLGVFIFGTESTISLPVLGREAEARGFESLFVPEHTHIPASRETPWPGGAEMPPEYAHALEPFVGLAAVASVTTRLRLGTAVCLVPEHDPILLAKEVATLDLLSGGRAIFGIGAGWNVEEMRNHGTDPARRFKLMRERVLAMKQIWTQDEASFHGEFVNFERIWCWPKPAQKPHPPILIGGDGPYTLQRVVDYADGWFPIPGRHPDAEEHLRERIGELNRLAAERGRGSIPVTIWGGRAQPQALAQYREMGVSRCVFVLRTEGEAVVLAALDRLAPLVEEFGELTAADR